MHVAADRLEFAPPPTPDLLRSVGLALLAHLVLIAMLAWGVSWKSENVTVTAEAELWSAMPQEAAPKLVEEPPQAADETPPTPVPAPPPKPLPAPPPPPQVQPKQVDADIALAQEKQRLKKEKEKALEMEQEKLRLKEREKEREKERDKAKELEKQRQEKLQLDKKRQQDKQLQDKREQEKQAAEDKKKAELEAKRKDALKSQQDAKRMETQREANLKRMAGLAGATGDANATGTALKSSGPSASYGGRIRARIKPNIVFTEEILGNPTAEIEVRTSPDGTIIGRKLVKSSGDKSWDEAVLKAIDKTEVLPRDTDGRVPSSLIISFRPKD
jgi:colicin import membrane protein